MRRWITPVHVTQEMREQWELDAKLHRLEIVQRERRRSWEQWKTPFMLLLASLFFEVGFVVGRYWDRPEPTVQIHPVVSCEGDRPR